MKKNTLFITTSLLFTTVVAVITFIAVTAAVLPVRASAPGCGHDDTAFRCVKFVRIYDGDTITVDIPDVHPLLGKAVGVRIRDVDTAEIKGTRPCEKEAARTAKRLVENLLHNSKRIDLVNIGRDKYWRVLADVMIDGRSVKDVLLKNKLAYSYDGGTKQKVDWCQRVPAGR
jgi:micrococcal nuclease